MRKQEENRMLKNSNKKMEQKIKKQNLKTYYQ